MRISVFSSGSAGNSTLVCTGKTSVLVDAGISLKRAKECLSACGLDIKDLDGIFITHEHTDHVSGIEKIAKGSKAPVYISKKAYAHLPSNLENRVFVEAGQSVLVGDMLAKPVSVPHDAADPLSYFFRSKGKSVGVVTDLGIPTEDIKRLSSTADALVLESNHDIDMLLTGPYPEHLKQRILGPNGHLSNIDAAIMVRDFASELKTVFLAHLSKNNNTEKKALDTFEKIVGSKTNAVMTNQEKQTELIKI